MLWPEGSFHTVSLMEISKSDTLNDHLWCSTRHLKGQHYDNLDILVEIWKAGIYRGQGSQVCCCCCCVASVVSDSVRPHRRQPIRLPHPWDSPAKNTGVGCHFLLQCMKVKSEREVAQSCLTRSNPMDCSPPGSSIHGIFQARVLEWGAIAFSIESTRLSKIIQTEKD